MQSAHDRPSRGRLIACLVVFPVLAYFSLAQTVAIISEHIRPDKAFAIAPWDGSVRSTLAEAQYHGQIGSQEGASQQPRPDIVKLAREGYMAEPLVPGALAIIGRSLPAGTANEFWTAAAQVSRRDPLLQGMLLQHFAERSDLDGSIRVLNQIIQVRAKQRRQLFAPLIQALRDPRSIDTFVDILKAKPDWASSFILIAARDKEAIDNLAALLKRLPGDITDEDTDRALVTAFATSNRLNLAYDMYTRLAARREGIKHTWPSELAPFDWELVDQPGFRARSELGSDKLRLNIARGKGGVFASRIVPARGNSIEIEGAYDLEPERQAKRLQVSVACMEDGAPIAQSNFSDGRIALQAAIPPDCQFLGVLLSGRAWSDAERISGTVSPLTINVRS